MDEIEGRNKLFIDLISCPEKQEYMEIYVEILLIEDHTVWNV
jgi:hypothetical protein